MQLSVNLSESSPSQESIETETMTKQGFFCCFWVILPSILMDAAPVTAQVEKKSTKAFRKSIVELANQFPFEKLEQRIAIYYLMQISESCSKMGRPELSQTYWNRVNQFLTPEKKQQQVHTLFRYALKLANLDKAKEVAKLNPRLTTVFLDRIDLERMRRAQKVSAEFPRQPLDFWRANEFGRALVSAREFEKAKKFVAEMKVPHEENDPRTIGAWIYRDIAIYHLERKEMDQAREAIDKSMEIGGKLYYTGLIIRMLHCRIHGTLKAEYEDLSHKAFAHRGFQGEELAEHLVAQLRKAGLFQQAKTVLAGLKSVDDRNSGRVRIALEQMKRGLIAESNISLEEIDSKNSRSVAQLQIAREYWWQGKKENTRKTRDEMLAKLTRAHWSKENAKPYNEFAILLGVTRDLEALKAVWKHPGDQGNKAAFLANLFVGLAMKNPHLKTE